MLIRMLSIAADTRKLVPRILPWVSPKSPDRSAQIPSTALATIDVTNRPRNNRVDESVLTVANLHGTPRRRKGRMSLCAGRGNNVGCLDRPRKQEQEQATTDVTEVAPGRASNPTADHDARPRTRELLPDGGRTWRRCGRSRASRNRFVGPSRRSTNPSRLSGDRRAHGGRHPLPPRPFRRSVPPSRTRPARRSSPTRRSPRCSTVPVKAPSMKTANRRRTPPIWCSTRPRSASMPSNGI